jgi:hypothetical protein
MKLHQWEGLKQLWVLSHEKEIRFLDHVPLVYVPLWTNKNALKRKVVGPKALYLCIKLHSITNQKASIHHKYRISISRVK